MSNLDELVANIEANQENLTKEDLVNFTKESLRQIKDINNAYKKLYEGAEDKAPLMNEIEANLEEIKNKYEEYFVNPDEQGKKKLEVLNEKITDIKNYHKEIFEGKDSIKEDIKESQDKITEFYVYLFGGDDQPEKRDEKVKKAIDEILNFNKKIYEGEESYENKIESFYQKISNKFKDLFKKDEDGKSKIKDLDDNIKKIDDYAEKIKSDTEPYLDKIKKEIDTKKKDVDSLLEKATGRSLIEGFLQSKNEYNLKPIYIKLEGSFSEIIYVITINLLIFLYSFSKFILDYILFIFPLLISVFIFIQPEMTEKIFNNGSTDDTNRVVDYVINLNFWGRIIISLPLWWISWFGQRNISHRKRLAEEYNHKAQVAKMYLNFTSRETESSYPITEEAKNELDKVLIDVIKRHPGEVYGKDETIMDKVVEFMKAFRGVTEKEEENNQDENNEK